MSRATLVFLVLGACGAAPSPRTSPGEPSRPIAAAVAAPLPRVASVDLGDPHQAPLTEFGPDILVPGAPAKNDVIAIVGDVEVRKSHVYDRLLENDRRGARLWVDLLIMDVVVAEQAGRFEIEIAEATIDELAKDEEETLRGQVELEWGERLTFDEYLSRQFGLTTDEYRRFMRLDVARMRYRALVMRYLAMLEDRVEVRFLVNRDRVLVDDLRQKVENGADFSTLATRHSEDETRRTGGYLAPFGRAFRHPVAAKAFELEPGAVSEAFPFDDQGVERFALVYCLRRMPAREVAFADVRDEIVQGLRSRPVTPFEQSAFTLQYCRATGAVDSGGATMGVGR